MVTQPGVYPYDYARVPAAPVLALGAAAGVPGSLGVVQGDGQIPYKPEAAEIKQENSEHWIDRDPELKCYLPGIPRAMYMPYPFQIVQSTDKIHMAFAFSNAARVIHLDKVEGPPDDTYMGHSVGRWEGDTLVVDVTNFNGKNWFDRAGNFHSDALQLVERLHADQPRRHPLRGDDRGSEDVYASVDHLDAALSPPGAERAAPRLSVHRVRGRVHVRASSQGTAGQALGRRDDDRGHHAQDSAGRQAPRLVHEGNESEQRSLRRLKPMRMKLAIGDRGARRVSLAATAVTVVAHHAFAAEFDANKPVEFTGTVTKMEWVNPHVWLHMDVKKPDGTIESWAFEAGTPNVLFRRGFTKQSLLPGTVVKVDGYQAKDGTRRANGRDLTFADGKKLFLGSSGTGAPYELARPGVDTEAKPK